MADKVLEIDPKLENDETKSKEMKNTETKEIDAITAHSKEIEEETKKLEQLQSHINKLMGFTSELKPIRTAAEKSEIDARSVYVGNVDYGASAEELAAHFRECGAINRVTIMRNKVTGRPKGFAYIEFGAKESVKASLALNDGCFRGRQIKVNPKRTNQPGMCTTNRIPRGALGSAPWGSKPYGHGMHPVVRRPLRGFQGRTNSYAPY
ncbi:polyadenylate-binding protein 2-like [Toxorhynchites rutilus septentrionalis]|uniref:polyadenylate-binding protein 2-like n=1 Tax=Toxorhynchites rutilus septentrionalis TaxID=329112 RepID=UPI002478DAAC|nr:polyadenylate-binding protein 2-like [Toxorhynchites rutilus septentrionalis]